MPASVLVTADSTRDDLTEAARNICAEAKALSRRGFAGVMSQRYADLHGSLDVLITELEMRDALGMP